jgi:DNA-binding MarR family transcriptional regulator
MSKLSSLRDAMRLCRQASPQIRASQIDFLISVAMHPGRTQTELATECDLTLAAISRAVDVMGESGRRDGQSGRLGLVETRRNKADDRILQVFLTPSGEQFVSLLETLTYGGSLQS